MEKFLSQTGKIQTFIKIGELTRGGRFEVKGAKVKMTIYNRGDFKKREGLVSYSKATLVKMGYNVNDWRTLGPLMQIPGSFGIK